MPTVVENFDSTYSHSNAYSRTHCLILCSSCLRVRLHCDRTDKPSGYRRRSEHCTVQNILNRLVHLLSDPCSNRGAMIYSHLVLSDMFKGIVLSDMFNLFIFSLFLECVKVHLRGHKQRLDGVTRPPPPFQNLEWEDASAIRAPDFDTFNIFQRMNGVIPSQSTIKRQVLARFLKKPRTNECAILSTKIRSLSVKMHQYASDGRAPPGPDGRAQHAPQAPSALGGGS